MKKIILFIFLFFFATTPVLADYATTYQNYINSNGAYQNAHNAFLTARANYMASGSIDSENKAKQATVLLLQTRDNLVANYLNAVKEKIMITNGISDSEKGEWQNRLNEDVSWHNAHLQRLNSSGSLNDSVTDSNEAKEHFISLTQITTYQSLVALGVGNNTYLREKMKSEISSLQSKIAEIKGNQDKDVSFIERSLVDIQNKINRSEEKDNLAKSLVSSLKGTTFNTGANTLESARSALVDSTLYLKEANQGLLQIITQIKTN